MLISKAEIHNSRSPSVIIIEPSRGWVSLQLRALWEYRELLFFLVWREHDAALVHISTDYVFGGDASRTTPYVESDCPAPINVYGLSKLAGEHFIRYLWPRHFIVRTSGLYGLAGSSGKGGNFVEGRLKQAREGRPIRMVADQC